MMTLFRIVETHALVIELQRYEAYQMWLTN